MTKTCKECGKKFEPYRTTQIYCCVKCRDLTHAKRAAGRMKKMRSASTRHAEATGFGGPRHELPDCDTQAMLDRLLEAPLEDADREWMPYVLELLTSHENELAEALYLLQAIRIRYRRALGLKSNSAKMLTDAYAVRKAGLSEHRVAQLRVQPYAEPRGAYA